MKFKLTRYQDLKAEQAFHAMVAAFSDGLTFTVQGFCARYGYKDNRHTRAVLNQMVKDGLLAKHKAMFDDGHYRYQYTAQLTKRAW